MLLLLLLLLLGPSVRESPIASVPEQLRLERSGTTRRQSISSSILCHLLDWYTDISVYISLSIVSHLMGHIMT
jgi:hypothetical protein